MQVNENVIHREIAGEHILVPTGEFALHRSGVFVITELGAEIWEMLKSGMEYDRILWKLLDEYEVTEVVLRADADDFLQMLRENALLSD